MNDTYKNRVTIYEVASVAGVSLATVSRVINNHPNVTEATKLKVENAIKKLGYRPSALAQALATSKTTNIGLIIPSGNYIFIANLLNGVTNTAKKLGYLTTVFVTGHNKEDARTAMNNLITSHVDGAIVFDDLFEEEISQITNYQVPVVVVNNRIDQGEQVACITFGYESTLRENIIRQHLQTSDKKCIFSPCLITGDCLKDYKEVLKKTHEEENKSYEILSPGDGYESYYNFFKDYFTKVKSGFFVAYRDSLANAITNAAIESGLKVPEDIEVLSLIGTRYATQHRPRISSMMIDMEEVGAKSLELLVEIMTRKPFVSRQKVVANYVKLDTTK